MTTAQQYDAQVAKGKAVPVVDEYPSGLIEGSQRKGYYRNGAFHEVSDLQYFEACKMAEKIHRQQNRFAEAAFNTYAQWGAASEQCRPSFGSAPRKGAFGERDEFGRPK